MAGRIRPAAVCVVLIVVVAGVAGWWAGQVAFTEGATELPSVETSVLATVEDTSIGQTLTYGATVGQPVTPVAVNLRAGVVTAVIGRTRVRAGDRLYAVDAQPVIAVEGASPFYRDLGPGSSGRDVSELQRFLVGAVGLAGMTGVFDDATTAAVRRWQGEIGIAQNGQVERGSVVAIPALPGAIELDEGIRVGSLLAGGEPAVSARVGEPTFTITLNPDQARTIPVGAKVAVTFEALTWDAVVTAAQARDDGDVDLPLTAPEGGTVCGRDCSRLPTGDEVSLLCQVEITPSVSGPAVPAAAVRTDASGSTYVTTGAGDRQPVTVLGSGNGVAVVDGLAVGERVVVLGDAADNAAG